MMANEYPEEIATAHSSSESQPSFEGRLKLSGFMYTSNLNFKEATPGRSSRLATPQSADSPNCAPHNEVSTVRSNKRKLTTPTTKSKEANNTTLSSPKKRAKGPSTYAPPSTYAHLPFLPDAIAPNLLILFIGLNPGVQTARCGHAYAHPSNLFWKLLYSSGITPEPCKAEDDRSMPERYSLGLTNIVSRPSRNGSELSKAEMDAGVEILEEKARKWRPEVVCVVGKSIWESIWRVRKGKAIKKAEFKYGFQDESDNMGVTKDAEGKGTEFEGSRVFVASSTSGLAATLRPDEKESIWKELGDWCVHRRKERMQEA